MSAELLNPDVLPHAGVGASRDDPDPRPRASPRLPTRPSLPARLLVKYCGTDLYVRPCRARANLIAAAVLALLAVAAYAAVDGPIARALRDAGIDRFVRRQQTLTLIIRWPGHLVFTLAVAAALFRLHPWRLQAAVLTLWGALFAGSNWILKWAIGRHRPHRGSPTDDFHPFIGGLRGLFLEPNLSMPSGDVTLAFALAAAVAWMLPRWRVAIFAWAALVALERLAENAHHLSDVLAGAALGLVAFHLGHFAATLSGACTARRLEIAPPRY